MKQEDANLLSAKFAVPVIVISICFVLFVPTFAGIKVSGGNPFLIYAAMGEVLVVIGMGLRLSHAVKDIRKEEERNERK